MSDSKVIGDDNFDEVDVFLNDDVRANVACYPIVTTVVAATTVEASIKEQASWHEAFGALKNEFKNGERVLNSIKELLPQGEIFISRIDFRGVMVCSRLLEVLGMFFKKVEGADKNLRHEAHALLGAYKT
ncbi:hypothetical protein C1H46_006028 [Malus baccata]|uniref:Uncharacterized protein n=1 Tax=Malus baccata TaxID=106549 RepID=A0A540ND27_MALBA|nr:hypothetical protein C1H46_006028 [Malus baccata]